MQRLASSFFDGPNPRVIGHRGAAGEAPENTLTSFERALADSAQYIELDVRASADGEVVVIHDPTVDRTTNGRGRVSRMSLGDLKRLDAGYRFTQDAGDVAANYPYRGHGIDIPTLEEVFSSLPNVKAIIEIKQSHPPIVARVIDTVRNAGKENDVLLATEEDNIMAAIRAQLMDRDPAIATGFCYGEVAAFLQWVVQASAGNYYPPGQAMQLPCEYGGTTLVTAATIAAAHALGLEMFVWTINEPAEMERLLTLGVDGIISDYPLRVAALAGGK